MPATARESWLVSELANLMAAIMQASGDIADEINTPEMALYCRGFDAAMAAVAAGIGIDPPSKRQRVLLQVDAPEERVRR